MENEFFTTPEVGSEIPVATETPVETKKFDLKKILTLGGIAVVAVAVVILLISLLGGNSYKTPLDLQMDAKNIKSYKEAEKLQLKGENGLFKKEVKALYEIEKKSDDYDDNVDEYDDYIRDMVDEYTEDYGKNYKFYYEIDDKDEIKKSDLNDSKKSLKAYAKQQEEYYQELKKDDDRLASIAEAMGLKKGEYKDMVEIYIDIYKELQKVEITAGYELDVTYFVKGSELDEPEELNDGTVKVYKIDGKWVIWSEYYDGFAEVDEAEDD